MHLFNEMKQRIWNIKKITKTPNGYRGEFGQSHFRWKLEKKLQNKYFWLLTQLPPWVRGDQLIFGLAVLCFFPHCKHYFTKTTVLQFIYFNFLLNFKNTFYFWTDEAIVLICPVTITFRKKQRIPLPSKMINWSAFKHSLPTCFVGSVGFEQSWIIEFIPATKWSWHILK